MWLRTQNKFDTVRVHNYLTKHYSSTPVKAVDLGDPSRPLYEPIEQFHVSYEDADTQLDVWYRQETPENAPLLKAPTYDHTSIEIIVNEGTLPETIRDGIVELIKAPVGGIKEQLGFE